MEPQVAPLCAILELNTDLLLNCLDGLSDEEALQRLEGGGNTRRQLGKPAMAYARSPR
jgi:hypothetical protein